MIRNALKEISEISEIHGGTNVVKNVDKTVIGK